jgi:hypothetical protein
MSTSAAKVLAADVGLLLVMVMVGMSIAKAGATDKVLWLAVVTMAAVVMMPSDEKRLRVFVKSECPIFVCPEKNSR